MIVDFKSRDAFEQKYQDLVAQLKLKLAELRKEKKYFHLKEEFEKLDHNFDENSFLYGIWTLLVSWNVDASDLRKELREFIVSRSPSGTLDFQEELFDMYDINKKIYAQI